MSIVNSVLGMFFTNTCPLCGKVLAFNAKGACKECNEKVKYVREPRCQKCGRPLGDMDQILCEECAKRNHHFDAGICIYEHTGQIKKSIYEFKYKNRREYGEFYAGESVKMYGKLLKQWNIDAIIPVPIHKDRERERGYNQATVFGQALARIIAVPIKKNILIRTKKTERQKELTDIMRYLNLKNAFSIDRNAMEGIKNVLVVDDIYTTGSTVDACSSILKKAGARKVYFLCISAGKGIEEA